MGVHRQARKRHHTEHLPGRGRGDQGGSGLLLQPLSRLDIVSELATGITHDIKQPLASISSTATPATEAPAFISRFPPWATQGAVMDTGLPQPKVFLVDDDDAARQSLSLLIAAHGLHVESSASAEEFLARWQSDAIGCLVLDIRMSGMSGLALQALLQERGIGIPVVFVTGHGSVHECRRAFQCGALDFLTKPVDEHALITSIRKGIRLAIQQRQTASEVLALRTRFAQLSDRERQVLDLILDGLPNKLIAREIGLSTRTVESHRSRIYLKLGANSLAQLVRSVMKLEDSMPREAAL